MSASIEMMISQQAGSLERILRVVRHRGFHIDAMQLSSAIESAQLVLSMEVRGERNIERLTAQLKKLWDVHSLTLDKGMSYARTA